MTKRWPLLLSYVKLNMNLFVIDHHHRMDGKGRGERKGGTSTTAEMMMMRTAASVHLVFGSHAQSSSLAPPEQPPL